MECTMTQDLDPYHGTDEFSALQKTQDQETDTLRDTPGAVIPARTFSTGDPLRPGWDRVRGSQQKYGRAPLACGIAPGS